jgi:hypothetical protein
MANNKNGNNPGGLPALGLFLMAGLIVSAWIAAGAVKHVKTAQQTIRVKGYAERRIDADMAVWESSYTTRGKDLVAVYEQSRQSLQKVLDFFTAQGLPEEQIEVPAVSTSIQYKMDEKGRRTNEIEGYKLTQRIEVKNPDVRLVEKVSRESASLISQGIQYMSFPPRYYFTRIEDLKLDLLSEATDNGRQRAQALATGSGSNVGSLAGATQGVFQITSDFSTRVDDYGVYDTSTIEKTVKAVVTLKYFIEKS